MRHFLKSIIAFAIVTLVAACSNETKHEVEIPTDEIKPFTFDGKTIKHTELSLNINP
jgi:outer membrane lipopolysaccharide assembly protein LptE/RlpB